MARFQRIATVKATGLRYIVNRIDFSKDPATVYCFGEVVRFKGASTRHSAEKAFAQHEVTIKERAMTEQLANELFEQADRQVASGGLPGYLTVQQTKARAKKVRAEKRAMMSIMRYSQRTGDMNPMLDLIEKVLAPLAEDRCEGCGKVASTEVEGMNLCTDCAAELTA